MAKRRRSIGSLRRELVVKSREAALNAVRVFNDPQVSFKSETFIVLMVIAWTYLLHAYYRGAGVEYRYFRQGPKRRVFERTKHGAYKYWELERCLGEAGCPIDRDAANNLRFLIRLRHEIEHQMTQALDDYLSGRYQACAMNYNEYAKRLFGDRYGIDNQLAYAIQLLDLDGRQFGAKKVEPAVPARLRNFVTEFDGALTHDEYNSSRFSYRLVFKQKLVNRPGQADRVVEFIDPKSGVAKAIDKEYWVRKEVERPKYRPSDVVSAVQAAGFTKFRVTPEHSSMWKSQKAKADGKGYGVEVRGVWYWYQSWVDRCIELCNEAGNRYR